MLKDSEVLGNTARLLTHVIPPEAEDAIFVVCLPPKTMNLDAIALLRGPAQLSKGPRMCYNIRSGNYLGPLQFLSLVLRFCPGLLQAFYGISPRLAACFRLW